MDLENIRSYAKICYDEANCKYDGSNYFVHIEMVVGLIDSHRNIFKSKEDISATLGAAYCHDLMEDAKQTYNDIRKSCGKEVADITLGVTDVPAENRLMKHLLTMGKTVRDHRAIILKMCDMLGNAMYSKEHGSRMYRIYVEEYAYRRPIFKKALIWYKDILDMEEVEKLWKLLDDIHLT
jgi:(p)ppGpp synthase/HD superfamily hydrolase